MSNRLSRQRRASSPAHQTRTNSPPEGPSRGLGPAPAVPRLWVYGTLGAIGLFALLVAAFSMWTILHKKLGP